MFRRILNKFRRNPSAEFINSVAFEFNTTPEYIRSEFVIDKDVYVPTTYLRIETK